MRGISVVSGLILCTAALAQTPPRIVCWTDEHGQRACGNTVPPRYAASELKRFNDQGVVVETRAREATLAERQAAEAAQARAEADAATAAKREAYDRFLLQTYPDAEALADQRDRRLGDLDGRRTLAEQALEETRKSLTDLRERAAKLQEAEKPVPERLAGQISSFAVAEQEHQAALDALISKQDELRARYDRDIERYNTLAN